MSLLDKWNKKRFSVYDSEEKSTLELMEKLSSFIKEEVIKEIDNKVSQGGDFLGSWQGIAYPTLSEEGLRGQVEQNILDISNINKKVVKDNILYSSYDSFDTIFNTFDSGTIILDKDITLTKSVNLPGGFSLISNNGSSITSSNFNAIDIVPTIEEIPLSGFDRNTKTITLTNADNIRIGDIVTIYPKTSDLTFSLEGIVQDVNYMTKKVILDDIPFDLVGTNLVLIKPMVRKDIIKGVKFIKVGDKENKKDIVVNNTVGLVIENCNFENAEGITLFRSPFCKVLNNNFYNTGDSCLCYDTDFDIIEGNKFNRVGHGVRCAFVSGMVIEGNYVTNGASKEYSTGIEISGTSLNSYKCCNNIIRGNKVYNINIGVLGSANGGIHLNFNAHHNLITDNIIKYNGIGIYLENYCENNTISNNISSYNGGYYGVGIELDWNCHYNKIIGNTCEYNIGSVQAYESCGIEIRSGKGDTSHEINNTIVSNNVCRYNGLFGILAEGRNTIITSNTLENNGSLTGTGITDKGDIMINNGRDITIIGNAIKNQLAVNSLIGVKSSFNVDVNSNSLVSGGSQTYIICVNGVTDNQCNGVWVSENNFNGASGTDRALVFYNGTNVRAFFNRMNLTNNGFPIIEFNACDNYLNMGNSLTGNTNIVEYQCTNKVTTL